MAVAYVEEEEVWKCLTHPSKRRRHGVCPLCLRDRLVNLCPNCANPRPCDCPSEQLPEPIFTRSRSLAVSFLRSKSSSRHSKYPILNPNPEQTRLPNSLPPRAKTSSITSFATFLSKLRLKQKQRKTEHGQTQTAGGSSRGSKSSDDEDQDNKKQVVKTSSMMMRSRSVGMALFSGFGSFREGGGSSSSSSDSLGKSKRWFPAAKQQSKAAKVNHENSPIVIMAASS